ncbi:MAG: hypothetical protein Q9227_006361 [Pyrenula ochraceoflavens]
MYTIHVVRFQCGANGYGNGLTTMWGVLWSATLLIFNDPQGTFQRVEKGPKALMINQSDSNSKGLAEPEKTSLNRQDAEDLVWQPCPKGFFHRLDWTLDLVTSFRGPGWNWRLPGLPKVPKSDNGTPLSASHLLQPMLTSYFRSFISIYMFIDLFKVIMIHDPYFWGMAPLSSPAPAYLPPFIVHSTVCTKIYRLTFSLCGVLCGLGFVLTLNPLFFGGIISRYFPSITRAPFNEPFLYPPQFGSPLDFLDRGLAGFWGKWWHQMFRFGISEPSRWLVQILHLNPRSTFARALQLLIAFTLTGFMHAAGSYTQFADTRPIRPFLFFIVQGLGILAQTAVTQAMGTRRLPRWLRRAGNGLFILVWAYYTGPLLADDFAKGGIWLLEPLPVSLLRGLGLGLPQEGFWCWHGKWFRWWNRGRWWERGFAVI